MQSSSVKILKLSGRIDSTNHSRLRKQIREAASAAPNLIILDMQDVISIDSIGLGVLLSALKIVKIYGGKLALKSVSESISYLLAITATDKLFHILRDESDLCILTSNEKVSISHF